MDRNMGGEWKPKGLILLAGGVGSGKTTFWVNSAKAMAKGIMNPRTGEIEQTPSLFFSLEMSREDLLMKMVADELDIDSGKILAADLEDEDYSAAENIERIERKMVELQQLPMYIIDNGRLTLAQMVYEIRKHVQKYAVRVVAIDYLQIVNHHPSGSANQDLGEFALAMKDLAKRENITIIILSQLNRSGEGINSIRDSGEVQAVVDVAVALVTDDDLVTSAKRGMNMEWWKNRYGAAGRKTPLLLNGPYHRFEEGS
jgi:replicative DNA helicase